MYCTIIISREGGIYGNLKGLKAELAPQGVEVLLHSMETVGLEETCEQAAAVAGPFHPGRSNLARRHDVHTADDGFVDGSALIVVSNTDDKNKLNTKSKRERSDFKRCYYSLP